MERLISLCITTFNRVEMTRDSFAKVYDDSRIGEVLIVDDYSDLEDVYYPLKHYCDYYPKVKLYRNVENIDCYANKAKALQLAKNDWCILLDSDNQIDGSYIDAIYNEEWSDDTALMPSFAKPTFSYKEFSGTTISKENVAQYMDYPMFRVMLNCHNFFVNRNTYLACHDFAATPHTADSIYQNYNFFKAGNKMKVVDAMEYEHLIHSKSHYVTRNHLTGDFLTQVENNLRNMKQTA